MEEKFDFDEFIAEVDAEEHSKKLIEEFKTHWNEVASDNPELAHAKEQVFAGWAIQKIAGLQLSILHLEQKLRNVENVIKTLL